MDREGRGGRGVATPLLAALHPRLGQVKVQTLERLFGLLDAEDFGPERVTELVMALIEPAPASRQSQSQWGGGQQSQSQWQQEPPSPPRPPSFKIGGQGFPLEDLGEAISARVEEALSGLTGRGSRPSRPGTILKIETEDENGGSFSANLPLSLASHAERLIPPHAQKALERSGLSIDAVKLLLQAGPPPGKRLEAEDENGNSVRLSIQ